jgi:hypothetical protein
MNKFLLATILAGCALALAGQRACAWGCGQGSIGIGFHVSNCGGGCGPCGLCGLLPGCGCGPGCFGISLNFGCPGSYGPCSGGGGGGCCTFGYPSDWFSCCYGWPTGCDYGSAGGGYGDMGYHGYPDYSGSIPSAAPGTTTPYVPPAPKPVPGGGTKPPQTSAPPAPGYLPVSYYPYPSTGSGYYPSPSGWYGR